MLKLLLSIFIFLNLGNKQSESDYLIIEEKMEITSDKSS